MVQHKILKVRQGPRNGAYTNEQYYSKNSIPLAPLLHDSQVIADSPGVPFWRAPHAIFKSTIKETNKFHHNKFHHNYILPSVQFRLYNRCPSLRATRESRARNSLSMVFSVYIHYIAALQFCTEDIVNTCTYVQMCLQYQ